MRVLVFSDSHGNVEAMEQAVARYRADAVFHLGDYAADAMHLRSVCPVPVEFVKGNCDLASSAPLKLQLSLDGKKILLTHGHEYRVKQGKDGLRQALDTLGVDIILFGHTHIRYHEFVGDKLLLNPGAVCGGWSGKSEAALLSWQPGGKIEIKELEL